MSRLDQGTLEITSVVARYEDSTKEQGDLLGDLS